MCVRACVRVYVVGAVCAVLILLLCTTVSAIKGMYVCLYVFVSYRILVLYYSIALCGAFTTCYMDLCHTNITLTN